MHYLVEFKTEQLAKMEHVRRREDVYVTPQGDRWWAILEGEDEESLRQDLLEGQEVEELQPVLRAPEYLAIVGAREYLEDSKARFVDDPAEALAEARRAVGRALEARGYPSPDRASEASGPRREVLQECQATDVGESESLEDMRGAFDRLSRLLDRLPHT